jgi:hypothetical protein
MNTGPGSQEVYTVKNRAAALPGVEYLGMTHNCSEPA